VGICKYKLQQDPMSGAVFAFINRSKTSIKLLLYDGQGLWLMNPGIPSFSKSSPVSIISSSKENSSPDRHAVIFRAIFLLIMGLPWLKLLVS